MQVSEIMTRDVELGRPDMTLLEVAQKMRDGDFGILPIGDNDRLVGMVSDRDLVIRGVAENKIPEKTQVSAVMSRNVLYCYEDETLEQVAQNLGDRQIRRLPVLNRQKRLVGILSLGDLAKAGAQAGPAKEALSRISESGGHRAGRPSVDRNVSI